MPRRLIGAATGKGSGTRAVAAQVLVQADAELMQIALLLQPGIRVLWTDGKKQCDQQQRVNRGDLNAGLEGRKGRILVGWRGLPPPPPPRNRHQPERSPAHLQPLPPVVSAGLHAQLPEGDRGHALPLVVHPLGHNVGQLHTDVEPRPQGQRLQGSAKPPGAAATNIAAIPVAAAATAWSGCRRSSSLCLGRLSIVGLAAALLGCRCSCARAR